MVSYLHVWKSLMHCSDILMSGYSVVLIGCMACQHPMELHCPLHIQKMNGWMYDVYTCSNNAVSMWLPRFKENDQFMSMLKLHKETLERFGTDAKYDYWSYDELDSNQAYNDQHYWLWLKTKLLFHIEIGTIHGMCKAQHSDQSGLQSWIWAEHKLLRYLAGQLLMKPTAGIQSHSQLYLVNFVEITMVSVVFEYVGYHDVCIQC